VRKQEPRGSLPGGQALCKEIRRVQFGFVNGVDVMPSLIRRRLVIRRVPGSSIAESA